MHVEGIIRYYLLEAEQHPGLRENVLGFSLSLFFFFLIKNSRESG